LLSNRCDPNQATTSPGHWRNSIRNESHMTVYWEHFPHGADMGVAQTVVDV